MDKKEQDIKTEILKIIDNDLDCIIKIVRNFLEQDSDFENDKFTGKEKVAMFLITIGVEKAAQIFNHLKEEEIEDIALEIANISCILPETKENISQEFYQIYVAQQYITEGGISYAKKILVKSLGESRAIEIIDKLTITLTCRPFDFIRKLNNSQITKLLMGETPQIMALVLSQLKSGQVSIFFNELPVDKQLEIIEYLASTESVSLLDVKEIEKDLEKKASVLLDDDDVYFGGINTITEILNLTSKQTEKIILEELKNKNKRLYSDIIDNIFVFNDILTLANNDIQKVLCSSEIKDEDLVLALKGTTEEVKSIILNNIIGERRVIIEYRLEKLGAIYRVDAIKAQQKIVEIIRKLQNNSEIIEYRGMGDEVIV